MEAICCFGHTNERVGIADLLHDRLGGDADDASFGSDTLVFLQRRGIGSLDDDFLGLREGEQGAEEDWKESVKQEWNFIAVEAVSMKRDGAEDHESRRGFGTGPFDAPRVFKLFFNRVRAR